MRVAILHSCDEIALEWYKWKQKEEITKINEETGVHEPYQPNEEELNKFKKEMKLARKRIIEEEIEKVITKQNDTFSTYQNAKLIANNNSKIIALVIIIFLSTMGCFWLILNWILIKVRKAANKIRKK